MPEVDFDINVTNLYAAIGKSDWDAATRAVQRRPVEAETWVTRHSREHIDDDISSPDDVLWRFLPLHSACARRPPSSFIRDLLMSYPEAASLKDESGMYPLHYACGNRASKHVIQQLVECYPTAAREADPQGMLPIHYIAQWGPSEQGIVELLLDVYPDGITVANSEGMTPLDLCREGNFDEWREVLSLMEGRMKKTKSDSSVVGVGSSSHSSSKRLTNKHDDKDSLVSSTIEVVRKSSKSPRSSSRSQKSERSSSRSSRASSRRIGAEGFDIRDEVTTRREGKYDESRVDASTATTATPRAHKSAAASAALQSLESLDQSSSSRSRKPLPPSIIVQSPRYHEMKTPRSSGRGPAGPFHFGQKTPRSTTSQRSAGRSVEFDFALENESTIRSSQASTNLYNRMSPPPPSPSLMMNHHSPSFQIQDSRSHGSVGAHDSFHRLNGLTSTPPPPSPVYHNQPQYMPGNDEHNMMVYQQRMTTLQSENNELRAKLANYEMLEAENSQLKAKLVHCNTIQNENALLHSKLVQLQDIQSHLRALVGNVEQREDTRAKASAERRKMLLELLTVEERHELEEQSNSRYKGGTLLYAFEEQIKSIEVVRREMERMGVAGNGGGVSGVGPLSNTGVDSGRMSNAFELMGGIKRI